MHTCDFGLSRLTVVSDNNHITSPVNLLEELIQAFIYPFERIFQSL